MGSYANEMHRAERLAQERGRRLATERRPVVFAQQPARLRDDQMLCPECGDIAESDSVDVGVGLYIRGNYECRCGWEYEADGRMNVASYDDYFYSQVSPCIP
jgi:hypothetical protein